ncbi:ester cyclase [Kitasatospora sp. NPDC127059]|uniref:ester cyclase n=1 Tax=unclassified Kitasatospora TaxID=2633591 RepID=UPI00365A5ACB
MTDKESFVRGLFEAWNNRDYDSITGAVAPDCTVTDMGSGRTLQGPEAFASIAKSLFDAMPDGRFSLDHLTAQGDTVAIEYTGQGTQTADLVLRVGTVPATGRSVTVHGCDVYEVENDKIKTARVYVDSGAIMAQLGLLQEKASR